MCKPNAAPVVKQKFQTLAQLVLKLLADHGGSTDRTEYTVCLLRNALFQRNMVVKGTRRPPLKVPKVITLIVEKESTDRTETWCVGLTW